MEGDNLFGPFGLSGILLWSYEVKLHQLLKKIQMQKLLGSKI